MPTNLHIEDELLRKARDLGGHRTKKEAVTQALIEYVRHLEQRKIVTLFGTVDFDEDYDYKAQRQRK